MEALTSCAPPRSSLCCISRRNNSLSIHFLRYPISNKTSVRKSLRYLNHLNESLFSSSLSCTITQAEVGSVDSKTVHVKFQLQKECMFGEQFLLVGDDPVLGLWDPSSAIPMDWSDEHIWNVNLVLPAGKSIQYKFLLKGTTEEVVWQPGPDRILETWETKNTIVVTEDWEKTEVQSIAEEACEENTKAIDDGGVITAEATVNESTVCVEEESLEQTKDSYIGENILGESGVVAAENAEDGSLVGTVGGPVLVPGLTPLQCTEEIIPTKPEVEIVSDDSTATGEEIIPTKPEAEIVSDDSTATGEAGEIGMPEPSEPKDVQHDSGLQERIQISGENDDTEYQAAHHDTLQNDFRWGRKTLHKLLTTLGLTLDQT